MAAFLIIRRAILIFISTIVVTIINITNIAVTGEILYIIINIRISKILIVVIIQLGLTILASRRLTIIVGARSTWSIGCDIIINYHHIISYVRNIIVTEISTVYTYFRRS